MGRFSHLEFQPEEEFHGLAPEVFKDERYYVSIADQRFHEGRFEEALRYASRALEFETRLPDAWLCQVLALIELDEPSEAKIWSEKGLEITRDHPELLAAQAIARVRLGDREQGLAMTDVALARKGASALRWRARGEALLFRDDRNAEFCFEKGLAEARGDAFEALWIGRVHLHYRRHAPALRYLERAADRGGSSAFVWENLGVCLEALGRKQRALAAYRNAVQLDRTRDSAVRRLAELEGEPFLLAAWRRVSSLFRN